MPTKLPNAARYRGETPPTGLDLRLRLSPHAAFAVGAADAPAPQVDRTAGRIAGVSLITADREAAGWEMWIDAKTVTGFQALLSNRRLKAYATHGSFGKDGTLDEVGFWELPRIDGLQLRADFVALSAWRRHSEAEFDTLFELAEKMPSEFGASVAFTYALAWVRRDGSEVPTLRKWREAGRWEYELYYDPPAPVDAVRDMPSVRPLTCRSADFVDQPAANDGLFRASPVDVRGSVDSPPPSPARMHIKDIYARFSANSAHVARAVALLSANDSLTLDAIAAEIAKEEQAAELAQLRAGATKHAEEVASFSAKLQAKDAEIARLSGELKQRDESLAALRGKEAGGAAGVVPTGSASEGAAAKGSNTEQIAALERKLAQTPTHDAATRGKIAAELAQLRAKS